MLGWEGILVAVRRGGIYFVWKGVFSRGIVLGRRGVLVFVMAGYEQRSMFFGGNGNGFGDFVVCVGSCFDLLRRG